MVIPSEICNKIKKKPKKFSFINIKQCIFGAAVMALRLKAAVVPPED